MYRCCIRSDEALKAIKHAASRQQHYALSHRRHFTDNGVKQQNIAVLGGGITGLATAYFITQSMPQAKVTIYESSDRIGGWLGSERVTVPTGSILFESGARSLRPAGNGVLTARKIDELDMIDDTIFTPRDSAAARHRYLYYPDHLVEMPHPAFGVFNALFSILREPVFKGVFKGVFNDISRVNAKDGTDDESVAAFFTRTLNKSIVDNIISGVIHGIYAGDVDKLSAKSLFPRQVRDDQRHASLIVGAIRNNNEGQEVTLREVRFTQEMRQYQWKANTQELFRNASVFTFREGLGQLVDKLARKLWSAENVEIKTSTGVEGVRLSEGRDSVNVLDSGGNTSNHNYVISTLASSHLNSTFTTTESLIPYIPSVTVMTVNLFYENHHQLPPGPDADSVGFGYLIPRSTPFNQNPERALGVVFDNAYSKPDTSGLAHSRAQDRLTRRGTKLTVMLGGHWWNDWPSFPDEKEGLAMAKAVVQRHLGIKQEPVAWSANLKRDCIPQYTVGHESRIQTAHKNLSQHFGGRLRVAGSWISGVGVNDCLRSAWDVVRGLEKEPHATGLEHVGNEQWARVHYSHSKQ